jgi:energy-coupling factor transport system substrate-specific component
VRARAGNRASLGSLSSWSTKDIVVGAVLAVAVGVIFWAWDQLWSTAFSAIPFPPSYLLVGVWMVGGILVPYVIRRPGAAMVGELVAAFVSMILVNQWGAAVMLSGLVQGAGAELVFASARWRKYSLPILLAAGAVAGVFSIALDSFYYSYWEIYTSGSILLGVVFVAISGAFLGGLLSKVIADLLATTGVLDGLAIGKTRIRRVG